MFYYQTKQKHQDQLEKIIKVIDGGLQLSPKRVRKSKQEVLQKASQQGVKDLVTKKTLIYMYD
jgi:hypothetical protein